MRLVNVLVFLCMAPIVLGGNSLLDLVVFGRSAGDHIAEELNNGLDLMQCDEDSVLAAAAARLDIWNTRKGKCW